jgi:hypothetical protein
MEHTKSVDKLVYMANQIGKFFAGQGPEAAASGAAEHIKKVLGRRVGKPGGFDDDAVDSAAGVD